VVRDATRDAATQLATWGAVEAKVRKFMAETERAVRKNFAEFLLSETGSRALVKNGDSGFRIEG
jgi:hypothetical protein